MCFFSANSIIATHWISAAAAKIAICLNRHRLRSEEVMA
jgi:hypothetical protein